MKCDGLPSFTDNLSEKTCKIQQNSDLSDHIQCNKIVALALTWLIKTEICEFRSPHLKTILYILMDKTKTDDQG